ncbi:DUF4287 domain-containing protein [Psychrobium sp. 1_MG-2023]|uniref:DUF4287 domain-containing protein n=1 Tax=Psychrobium sp. 1_MG-2023 TaxID=3062624 RepID=UPI000C329E58|nr:DUF4287 domain-containing protein [Psychrobium sp. 1_MG-2023]MDP2560608.1 DUF4287 domain-containing protein [Psychrobium sp. 1_MG-2023]PKF57594.1 DUF4287 domain-containing protein [Alteromonadales bacterium alter-6D02]
MDKVLKTMIDNMPEKTGKALGEWIDILATKHFDKHSAAVNFLKTEYGVTHGFANTIVTLSKDEEGSSQDLVFNQYQGKEALKPIYDVLLSEIAKFGGDVVITPKKASVSVIRNKQFALIKPATKTRIDLGLKLKGVPIQGCLGESGPFGTMCTHRIQLKSASDVDQEVIAWLLRAYEASL